ncbi:hypothetical protein [Synechococcus phage BUCT-ZZ01]|nr:hypothetical protein [Synechococcus phage BUCT-ZZ01]
MRPEELLVDPTLYQPTGNRQYDLAMAAFAGLKVDDYNNEIELGTPERQWCNAVLRGEPMPTFDYSGSSKYEFCHLIFYATDFGRKPVDDAVARQKLIDAALTETDVDLLAEYAVAMKCVLGTPTQKMLTGIDAATISDHHLDLKNLFGVR